MQRHEAVAGPDQVLEYVFETTMEADDPAINETGSWSIISGSGKFADIAFARTTVSDLSIGVNYFVWTVTNGVCPSSQDSVIITVQKVSVPTLLTPNMDGKNDYFKLTGIEKLEKPELVVFKKGELQE